MKRKYSNKLKATCIEMYIGLEMTANQIGKEMGIDGRLVHDWVTKLWQGKVYVRYGRVRSLEMITKRWES